MAKDRLEIASFRPRCQRASALVCLGEHKRALVAVPAPIEQARAAEAEATESHQSDAAAGRVASDRALFTRGPLDNFKGLVPNS